MVASNLFSQKKRTRNLESFRAPSSWGKSRAKHCDQGVVRSNWLMDKKIVKVRCLRATLLGQKGGLRPVTLDRLEEDWETARTEGWKSVADRELPIGRLLSWDQDRISEAECHSLCPP
ncbi:MAG: hypothetical protein DMG06_13445 [Acidobacteria bacterium]|nr:MAG: hypothetical protein DMG06_13445 [Acidobacteriota bacterium]